MSKIYLLTNKVTYARATVLASNAEVARGTRPDGKAVWRHGRWHALGVDLRTGREPALPKCPAWPGDVELVAAQEIGEANRQWRGGHDTIGNVLSFDANTELRHPGDGPDESWGALFGELKSERPYSGADVKALQQLKDFHKCELVAPDLGRPCRARVDYLAAHSALIDLDPMAADGHEDTLFDYTDTDLLRQLVHFVQKRYRS